MIELLNAVLVVMILGLAVETIAVRDAFAATVGFLVYGLLLAFAWVSLGAIDVAMTEAAIGAGLTGALLIGAASRLRDIATPQGEMPTVRIRVLAGAFAAAVSAGLAACVLWLPEPAPTLAAEVAANLGATGVGNPITGVLMAFRALDTLLEATVLLFAVLGVWSLSPDRFWGGRPGPAHRSDPDGILAYLGRVLPPIGIVIAIYILWVGADAPGGKFQGATILAAMWLLVIMAGLVDVPPVSRRTLRLGLVAGPAVFIALGFVGAAAAGAFLAWPSGLEKALIVVVEVALLPSLAITLGLLLSGAPQRPPS
jgi:multisubunit Na+/H+ antiporter MnhB subunit